jgi:hypothetical protein
MSTPIAARRHRRTPVLSAVPWIALLPLTQAGLGYLSARSSSPWSWLIGTPLSYLLIAMLAAFCACGGLAPVQARRRGASVGIIAGLGGAVLAALIAALLIILLLHDAQVHPPSTSRLPGPGLALLALFFWFVPLFLTLNLLGIALAPLGGMLGGYLRSQGKQEDQSAQEWTGERDRARTWSVGMFAVIVIAMLLALVTGIAFIVLTLGVFA